MTHDTTNENVSRDDERALQRLFDVTACEPSAEVVTRIRSRAHAAVTVKTSSSWWQWAMAAVLLAGVGGGVWFIMQASKAPGVAERTSVPVAAVRPDIETSVEPDETMIVSLFDDPSLDDLARDRSLFNDSDGLMAAASMDFDFNDIEPVVFD